MRLITLINALNLSTLETLKSLRTALCESFPIVVGLFEIGTILVVVVPPKFLLILPLILLPHHRGFHVKRSAALSAVAFGFQFGFHAAVR